MLVLYLFSTLHMPNGKPFCVPFGVEDESLEAFVERLNGAGVVSVTGLKLTQPDQAGVQHIIDSWPFGLGVGAVGTIVNNRHRVAVSAPHEDAA